MGRGYGRELRQMLAAHGCRFVRHGKGDHEIWYSPITNRHISIDAGTKKRFTATSALKQAGIEEKIR